ncbi:MAG: phage tail protein [Alphaproteobacteria bacterium]|nr:phage tail protein [Alphaproteobacteria bacterium]
MAQLAVAAAGAAVGSLFGAPQVGWLVGSFIGSQLFGGEGGKVEGPRLGDLQVQASTYGMGIPQIYGSMRIAGNVIWAKPLIEKRQKETAGKGGGGPTVVSYSYFATFAVAFSHGPIGAIRRVWADGKLLVDLSETAPQGKTYRYDERIYRLHLGTEDQDPDPVIEMYEGAGNAPAYRGLAYITFDELPLEDLGNRIPNITAEIVAVADTVHPKEHVNVGVQVTESYGKADWRIDPERPWIYNLFAGRLLKINRVSGDVIYQEPVDDAHAGVAALWAAQGWGGTPSAFEYAVDGVSGDLFIALNGVSRTTFVRLDADSLQIKAWYRQGFFTPGPMLVYAGRYMVSKSSLNDELVIIDFGDVTGPTRIASIDYNSRGQDLAVDPENKRLYVLTRNSTGAEGWISWIDFTLERRGIWHLENDLGLPAGSAPIGVAYDRASARLIIGCSTGLFACDPETLDVKQSLLGGYVSGGFVDAFENQPTIDGDIWLPKGDVIHHIDTVAMTSIGSWDIGSLHGLSLDAAVHDPLTEALWTSDNGVWKLWFERKGHGDVTLGEVVTKLCERSGLASADIDVTELDQPIQGYMLPRPVAVREALEQLQQAYPFDVVESDWQLAFRMRERAPVATIDDEMLAAHEPGNDRPPKLLETRTQEAELPRRVTVRYLSRENDYQAAAQQVQLIQDLYETKHELVLELPIVMTDDEAKRAASAILASAWVERDGFELFLPPAFMRLDPGDVVQVEKVSGELTADLQLRLTEIDLSGGCLLRLKAVTDDPIVWQTSHVLGAPVPKSGQAGIPFDVPSQGFFLNLPALSADDGQSGGFWLGAAPAWSLENTSWRGAVVYRSSDGISFSDFRAITTPVAWAKAATVLPAYDRWGVWDEDNVLEVAAQTPGLAFESRSDLEVLDGANLLLVGQEIIQFASAVQIGPLTWRLSRLLRGRYGTEWAISTHQPGETVLLLDPTALTRVSSLDEVGIERLYRTVSIGSDPSLPDAIAFTNEAKSLKPNAPVHIQGSRNGAGDLTITWIRRTRYGGAWRDLVDVPLNETSEAYEIDVLDQADTVLRTLASSSPTVTYTAADQTSDFGAPQSSIAFAVHQLSTAVGRGFAGSATL